VGQEAFLQILPVYVDHILYATMWTLSRIVTDNSTSTGCLTEVHHINGEGKDAGVVYSEMQGRQNQSGDLMELAKHRLMFPEGSGYRSETGGLMEALRVLDVQTIRE
jgi:Zn-dependent M16 (insulinase) family peptidase